ncbi:MAG: coproporphyrinogen dehydrogenase HemZ [Oscillospiraceae bacterium]|nr:coproporphyrinogen dehydrogenase HemZ [Oscillospiraceae bacterium]
MHLTLPNEKHRYEMENLLRLFGVLHADGACALHISGDSAHALLTLDGRDYAHAAAVIRDANAPKLSNPIGAACITDADELALAQALGRCLLQATGRTPPWGLLTGVRPTKLFRRLVQRHGLDTTRAYFADALFVRPEKIALAEAIYRNQRAVLEETTPQSFSLYVGIPFCPTRCAYCSFVSHSITESKAQRLIPQYVEKLCEELAHTGMVAHALGLRLESVYFGGGTPTSLSAAQLDTLLTAVKTHFDLSTCREYTVEAGRPDTVTAEKFALLQSHGVGRVSVNPQTFSDAVLRTIGRAHTAQAARDAYALARQYGFAVNMDFIAGLPGDTPEGFAASIAEAIALAPENITVHALARKRAAALSQDGQSPPEDERDWQLEGVSAALTSAGYAPYYSYRQSKSLGALENTGWAKRHFASRYNIYMMEELHTVLSCGAGAVTKLKDPRGETIERVFNFKYPYEYVGRFAQILSRKDEILRFYGEIGQKN